MPESTRRGFIKVAGTGAAAVGVAAVLPAAAASAAPKHLDLPKNASGALVVYIEDVKSGKLSVMVEGREVEIVDHQLVNRLAHAIHTAQHSNSAAL